MKLGTPGFIGIRLVEAREARGFSGAMLAEAVGVSRQAISQYERGEQSPRPEVMERICSALRLPPRFFSTTPPPPPARPVLYRSLASTTKGARLRADRRLSWLRELASFVDQHVDLPKVNFPEFDVPEDPRDLSMEAIEEFATECRRFWGMGDGPISNMTWLLENNGAVVARLDLDAEKLDGLSSWLEIGGTLRPHVLLDTEKASAVRSRFDCGHELGHLVLHRSVTSADAANPATHKLLERQAHRFAAAFLLPGPPFAAELDFPSLTAMKAIKKRWRVSIAMMVMRARQLEFIDDVTETRLQKQITIKGWRTGEPFDDELPPEEPRLVREAIRMLVEQGGIARETIPNEVPLALSDLEDLSGIPAQFFSSEVAQVVRLHLTPRRPVDPGVGEVSNVVPLSGRQRS